MGKKKGKGRGNHDLDTMSEVSSVMSVSSYNTNRSDDEFDEHFGKSRIRVQNDCFALVELTNHNTLMCY